MKKLYVSRSPGLVIDCFQESKYLSSCSCQSPVKFVIEREDTNGEGDQKKIDGENEPKSNANPKSGQRRELEMNLCPSSVILRLLLQHENVITMIVGVRERRGYFLYSREQR